MMRLTHLFLPYLLSLLPFLSCCFRCCAFVSSYLLTLRIDANMFHMWSRRIDLDDQNVMPVSALANRYEVLPLVAQCEGYMKVTPQILQTFVSSLKRVLSAAENFHT